MAEKMWRISICMIMAFLLCACAGNTNMEKKVRDLDFTVVSTADISEELKKHIDERKEESFTLIYRDGEEMYLIVGYGRQSGGGFSIRVNDLYLGENAGCVSTTLEGPGTDSRTDGETAESTVSFPYIVLKMETMDAPVIFDI